MLRAIASKRFSLIACTTQAPTMSNSNRPPFAHSRSATNPQHKHEYNAHCNNDSDGLEITIAKPPQAIEIPVNPSPLYFFAMFSHIPRIAGFSLRSA